MSDCVKAVKSAVKDGTITEAEAKEILQRVENSARARQAEKGLNIAEALKEIAGEMAAGDNALREITRRNRLLSIAATAQKLEKVTEKGKFATNIRDQLVYTADSSKALETRFLIPVEAKLRELGLQDVFRGQQHSLEFYLEAHNVGAGGTKPVAEGEIGAKIHEFMKFYVESRRQRLAMMNRYGAYIQDHDNYGFLQSYSRDRLWELGGKIDDGHKARTKAKFRELVDSLNIDPKTYAGRDKDLFWQKVFDNLYSGKHIKTSDGIDVDRFSGVHGSLANRISTGRLVWFADAESQWRWNEAIGSGGYAESILGEINNAARNVTLMREWGPNWRNNLDLVSSEAQRIATERDDSATQVRAFEKTNLPAYARILSGEADISTRPTLSKWLRNAIAFTHLSKMGSVVIASFPDVAMVNHQLAANGIGSLERFGAVLSKTPDDVSSAGMNVLANGFIGSLHNRFGVGELSGLMSRASHKLFQLNLFNRWNDVMQETTAKTLSWWMGQHSAFSHEALPEGLRFQLSEAGIGPHEWNAIRKTAKSVSDEAGQLAPEAKKFVLVDEVRNASEADIDAIAKSRGINATSANRQRIRDELDAKLATYFQQQIDSALNTPNLRTKYVTTLGGSQSGTLPRNIADLLMVFKSFPISVALRMTKRAQDAGLFSGKWSKAQYSFAWQQAQLIALSGVAGYTAVTTRDLLNGRTRRSLFSEDGTPNAAVWVDALAKGGGLGIYGDFLFSEYDRQYRSALNVFAGPVFGMVDQVGSIYTGARRTIYGDEVKTKPVSELGNLAMSNLPFANLFYLRPLLNAFVFYNMREMLSPGVLRRSEKAAREMNYQDFWIEPSTLGDIPITEPGRKLEAITEALIPN